MGNSSKIVNEPSFEIYRFGDCYIDIVERKVFKSEKQIDIATKAFDILQFLIQKQGEIVAKDEILTEVWDDSFVEEGNLTVYVSKLRKLLDADKSNPFIETVTGVGYRFISRAYPIEKEVWNKLRNQNEHIINVNESTHPNDNSIAVVPLINENGDEEIEYLTDGITESIINNLSYIPNLRVIARNTVFRYKDEVIDFQQIGKELNVSNILTGRIRIIRNNLTISVELINTNDGSQIWGTQINQPFKDIFEVQDKITQTISEKLKTQINEKAENLQSRIATQNLESYRLYLKGNYFLHNRSLENISNAIDCFQQSVLQDPTNVMSYVGIADCYRGMYLYEKLSYKEFTERCLSLITKVNRIINKPNAEFCILKGYMYMFAEFKSQEAQNEFQIAISLNPNSIDALFHYSRVLAYAGNIAKSLENVKEIIKLDPISFSTNKSLARIFYVTEQNENAIKKLQESLELKPLDFETLVLLGTNLVETQCYKKALHLFDKVQKIQFHVETLSMISHTHARAGNIKKAEITLQQLEKHSKNTYVPSAYFAIIYSALEDNDNTFKYLEKAFKEKNSDLAALKVDPRYKPIRNDLRFNEMLLKIGLPID